jgi:hypothetical protein
MDDKDARMLSTMPNLTKLDSYCNDFGDEGVKALATSKSLTSLAVHKNQIGNEGAQALTKNLSLTSLNIAFNEIGKEGIEALIFWATQNEALSYLSIIGNPGRKDVSDALEKMWNRKTELVKTYRRFDSLLYLLKFSSDLEGLVLEYCKPVPFVFHDF